MTRAILIITLLFGAHVSAAQTEPEDAGERDGQVASQSDGEFLAWDAVSAEWLSPVAFWRAFAARERGRNWGEGQDYPAYGDVREHDAFLVHTANGPCLMYFFHTRWRRANDVWRWGPEFNLYGGCPTVFD
ncbi:MAG: hypothetical protein AAGA61_01660 [Pseudomonadota bacterium]